MDSRLDENEAEFRVNVFAVALEVLADGNGLTLIVSADFLLLTEEVKEKGDRVRDDATFLINMYRSSGISGARPVT